MTKTIQYLQRVAINAQEQFCKQPPVGGVGAVHAIVYICIHVHVHYPPKLMQHAKKMTIFSLINPIFSNVK
jgi:hypothetical protein